MTKQELSDDATFDSVRLIYPSHRAKLIEVDEDGNRSESIVEGLAPDHASMQGMYTSGVGASSPVTSASASPDQVMGLKQLATHLGVSERTIRRMVEDGQIPYLRVRSEVRFHLPEVLSSLTKGGPRAHEEKGHQPRPAPGPLQENPQGSALLGDPEEDRRNDVPQVARVDEQGASHHGVPQGARPDPRRIAIRRPRSEKE